MTFTKKSNFFDEKGLDGDIEGRNQAENIDRITITTVTFGIFDLLWKLYSAKKFNSETIFNKFFTGRQLSITTLTGEVKPKVREQHEFE